MPKRYRSRSRSRRRGKKRRGIIRRRIPRAVTSREKLVKCKVVNCFQLTSTSGALASQNFKMFDITDPLGSGGTAQPLGYDQWKGLYNKAFVVGVKALVRFHNKGTAAIMVGITPMPENAGSTALGNLNHYMELAQTKSRLLSPDVDHCVLVSKVGTARHVGIKKLRDEDAFHVDLDGETAPTRDAWYHVWTQPVDQTSTVASELVLTVEFLIHLYDPIIPARSADT